MTFKYHISTSGWGRRPIVREREHKEGALELSLLPIWAQSRFDAWRLTDMREPLEVSVELRGGNGWFRCEMLP